MTARCCTCGKATLRSSGRQTIIQVSILYTVYKTITRIYLPLTKPRLLLRIIPYFLCLLLYRPRPLSFSPYRQGCSDLGLCIPSLAFPMEASREDSTFSASCTVCVDVGALLRETPSNNEASLSLDITFPLTELPSSVTSLTPDSGDKVGICRCNFGLGGL